MAFVPHTQQQLHAMKIKEKNAYYIEYVNKDYFNGEETLEKGKATALINEEKIYFSVVDPYGMDKLIMQAKVLAPA